jgi:hypothetical protein
MNETQISIAGIVFLISTLCACGGGQTTKEALTAAGGKVSTGSGGGGGQAGQHGKGKGADNKGKVAQDGSADETCDAAKIADPTTVVLCDVSSDATETRQVCTDAATALSAYGLDPTKPNLIGSDGDHLGAC